MNVVVVVSLWIFTLPSIVSILILGYTNNCNTTVVIVNFVKSSVTLETFQLLKTFTCRTDEIHGIHPTRMRQIFLDHLDPGLLLSDVVHDLYGTDPTNETCPESCRLYASHAVT